MALTRRRFLQQAAPVTLLPLLPGCPDPKPEPDPSTTPFQHGLASGDPLSDRVILWTRVTPRDLGEVMRVEWVVASDPELRDVETKGHVLTGAAEDFTVKVDARKLKPGRTYYYRFSAFGQRSVVGRTKTLPVGHVERLRVAVASCSNFAFGFFNAYGRIAARTDLDLVLHLGDYLYEYENGAFGDGTAQRRPRSILRATMARPAGVALPSSWSRRRSRRRGSTTRRKPRSLQRCYARRIRTSSTSSSIVAAICCSM